MQRHVVIVSCELEYAQLPCSVADGGLRPIRKDVTTPVSRSKSFIGPGPMIVTWASQKQFLQRQFWNIAMVIAAKPVHDLPVSSATACVSQAAHWMNETEGYSSFQKIDRLSYLSFTYLSLAGWTGRSLSRTASGTMRLEMVSQLKVVEGGLQVASSYQLALTPLPSHRLRVSFVCANTDNSPRGAHR